MGSIDNIHIYITKGIFTINVGDCHVIHSLSFKVMAKVAGSVSMVSIDRMLRSSGHNAIYTTL